MSPACARARAWLSLEVDGELSELERRLLDSHLDECEPCQAFQKDVVGFTFALRSAEPEEPSRTMTTPLRRRRSTLRVLEAGAAVAAAAVLTIIIGLSSSHSPNAVFQTRFVEPAIAFGADSRGLPQATSRVTGLLGRVHVRVRRLLSLPR